MKGLLITYMITAGGALAALLNPFYGLLAYVCLAIIKPEAMWPWAVEPGRYSMILALSMLVGWSYSKRSKLLFAKSWSIVAALMGFLLWAVIGAIVAPNQGEAWAFVEALFKIAVPFCVGLTTLDSADKLKQLAWVMVLSQGYVAYELNMDYFRGYNSLATSGFGALDNNSAAIALVTGLGVAAFLGIESEKLWQKGMALTCAALMGHAVLFSLSRGGMLAMMITGATAFVVIPKSPKHYFAFLIIGALGFGLAGEGVRARFMTAFTKKDGAREASAQSRLDLWENCWDVMKKSPVMGCGPNHWPLVAPNYGWPLGKEAHSLWMQTGAETGFVGLGLLGSFYLICMGKCWLLTRRRTEVSDPFIKTCAQMSLAGLTGFSVSAQFVSLEALEIPYYVVLLGAGALRLNSIRQPFEDLDAAEIRESHIPVAEVVMQLA